MGTFQNAERDAQDLEKLVNENTTVTTRYGNNPKKSWDYLIDEKDATFAASLSGYQTQVDDAVDKIADYAPAVVGDFTDGFTFNNFNEVGKYNDGLGNPDSVTYWSYNGSLPFVVPPSTVPTAPTYNERSVNDHNSLLNRSDVGAHDDIYNRKFDTLKDLDGFVPVNGQSVDINELYSGNVFGGGVLKYDASRDKADHNGISVISPESIAAWNGTSSDLMTFYSNASVGTGCWIKLRGGEVYGLNNVSTAELGCKLDFSEEAQDIINHATNAGFNIYFSKGVHKINPSTGVIIRTKRHYTGFGDESQLLAVNDVAGSVVKREFNPLGPNEYVRNCRFSDFSIFLNHLIQPAIPANIQYGLNLSSVTRSCAERVYTGNFTFGEAETYAPNPADKTQAMRGIGIVLGNVSASDPAYAGGEVNVIDNCRAWRLRIGIGLDTQELTGGVSACYTSKIINCDIQTVESGIVQQSGFNTGCTFENNTIQDILNASGSTANKYAYEIFGYENIVDGGYLETNLAELTAGILFETAAVNNEIRPFYSDLDSSNYVEDKAGGASRNVVKYYDSITKEYIILEGGVRRSVPDKAYVIFDELGNVIEGINYISVTRTGLGDFQVIWDSNPALGIDSNSWPIVSGKATVPSGNPIAYSVVSHSATTSRVVSYDIIGAAFYDAERYIVTIK